MVWVIELLFTHAIFERLTMLSIIQLPSMRQKAGEEPGNGACTGRQVVPWSQ